MKTLIALSVLAFSSISFAAYTPDIDVSVGNDKSVYVIITNDSGADLECKYSVSWFVNTLSYRNEFGQLSMSVGSVVQLSYKNNQYDRLSKIRTKVECL